MLTLTLELTQAASAPEVTVVLTNTGDQSVLINRRLTLNHPAQLEECREVYLRVLTAAREEIPFSAFLTVGELTNEDFAPLAARESVKQTYTLTDYYTLAQPGSYSIQAFYENVFDPNPGEAWKGKLESNVVKLDL